jgi:5-methylcytosine-specific restriction endonuclease McrA
MELHEDGCVDCGAKRYAALWCSRCYQRHKREPGFVLPKPPRKICDWCGKEFQPRKWGAIYRFCSRKCGQQWTNHSPKSKEYQARYRSKPEKRERRLAYLRRWHQEHKVLQPPKPRIAWNKGLTTDDPRVAALVAKLQAVPRKRPSPSQIIRKRHTAKRGADNLRWRGGITPAHNKWLTRYENRLWRRIVLRRYHHRCVMCGATQTKLVAHHLIPRITHPALVYHPDNGVPLCIPCHRHLHGTPPKDPKAREKWHRRILIPPGVTLAEALRPYVEGELAVSRLSTSTKVSPG